MRVLTVYASAHGSTAEVAGFMAAAWRERGIDNVGSIQSVEGYDAYALGSAVHNGLWLPEMAHFVRKWLPQLSGKPVYPCS